MGFNIGAFLANLILAYFSQDGHVVQGNDRKKEEELISIWWKEYADCSEGPKETKASSSKLDAQLKSPVLESAGSPQLFTAEEERVGVPVKGGLYEVWHRRTFQQSGLFAARVDLQGSTLGLHALFTREDDTWEA